MEGGWWKGREGRRRSGSKAGVLPRQAFLLSISRDRDPPLTSSSSFCASSFRICVSACLTLTSRSSVITFDRMTSASFRSASTCEGKRSARRASGNAKNKATSVVDLGHWTRTTSGMQRERER